MTYRIKEEQNRTTNKVRYRLQYKVLWGWCDSHNELGWGCSEPIVTKTREECEKFKRVQEEAAGW
ncbi:hypothetical protein LCGC14_1656280 [marine sediment metagenome]|uniref:Uncharacterized protein n=1 Tax=marine sediment metagenome TaxID=412755 RepID=A0A0F9KB60_9ZZZZ